jgi:hypothetical protein
MINNNNNDDSEIKEYINEFEKGIDDELGLQKIFKINFLS